MTLSAPRWHFYYTRKEQWAGNICELSFVTRERSIYGKLSTSDRWDGHVKTLGNTVFSACRKNSFLSGVSSPQSVAWLSLCLQLHVHWSLQLGVKWEFNGCGVTIELFQIVECSLLRKKYMNNNIPCRSAKYCQMPMGKKNWITASGIQYKNILSLAKRNT